MTAEPASLFLVSLWAHCLMQMLPLVFSQGNVADMVGDWMKRLDVSLHAYMAGVGGRGLEG